MISRALQTQLRSILPAVVRVSLVASVSWVTIGLLLGWHRLGLTLEDSRVRILLTMVGFCVGAGLGMRMVDASRVFRRSSTAGLVALLAAHVCYLLLVWTSLKTEVTLWRIWWICAVGVMLATHVMALRVSMAGRRRGWIERMTIAGAIVVALLLASLALRKDILADWGTTFIVIGIVPAIVTAIGSVVAWMHVRRDRPPRAVAKWQRVGWLAGGLVAIFVLGFYAGRVSAPPASALDVLPSALSSISEDQLAQQLRADVQRLRVLAKGVDELHEKSMVLHAELDARRAAEKRDFYTPEEDDRVRSAFMSYLAYRAGLLRMVATYAGFESVRNENLRGQCFLVGYGAGTTVLQASLTLVGAYRNDDAIRRKLNEAEPRFGMPAGMFDRIYEAVSADRNVETFEEMAHYFEKNRDRWKASHVLPAEEFDFLDDRIKRSIASVRAREVNRPAAWIEQIARKVKSDAYTPIYATQSVVSTWIGDVRLVERPAFITDKLIAKAQSQLQPGDILLERRNWFTSNAFLPGFWPHGALYVGTILDLEKLGLAKKVDGKWTSDDANVRERLEEYLKPAEDGAAHTVIESVSEGVIFNSFTESMHADYVAVLRPRLSDAQKATAISRAFSHQGKPYDFEFDFFSSDKLVCTELVYRAYEGLIHFDLVRIMGRDTLPAVEICRKFDNERRRADRQLDFVLFLDTKPGATAAEFAGEEEFVASAGRPRGFNE